MLTKSLIGKSLIGKYSPWGKIQSVEEIAEGITFVFTASHGGVKLSPKRNKIIPKPMRKASGWYEEDCEVWKVNYFFAEEMKRDKERAISQLKNWFPYQYEAVFGEEIPEGQSYKKDKDLFFQRNVNNWVSVSAFGEWSKACPKGFTLICATLGGKREGNEVEKWFLIPKDEYKNTNFVVNPEKHREVETSTSHY